MIFGSGGGAGGSSTTAASCMRMTDERDELGATIGGTNAYEASGVKDASMMMQMRCGSFQEASSLS